MKNKRLKFLIVVLIFFLCFLFIGYKSSNAIYRDVYNTKVYISVLDPATSYTIDFDSTGGESVPSITRTLNAEIGKLPIPTREGYNFVGWYTEDGSTKIHASTIVTGDVTYYAHWQKVICKKAAPGTLHTETCSSGGGCLLHNYAVGDTITYGTIPINTYPTAGDAYDCDVNNDGIYSPTTERFYYIRKIEGEQNKGALVHYTSFDETGQMDSSQSRMNYTYDEGKAYLPDSTTWTNPSLTTFDDKVSRYINGDDILTACGNPMYLNDKSYTHGCIYMMENSKYQSSSLGRAGIWIDKVNNQLIRIQSEFSVVQNPNKTDSVNTVRPVIELPFDTIDGYKERETYYITFDTQGGSAVSRIIKNDGDEIGTLPKSRKVGYKFAGWYTDTTYTTQITSSDIVTRNITLYAKWEESLDNLEYVFHIPGSCTFNGAETDITSGSNDCISTVNSTSGNIDYTATSNKYIDTGVSLYSHSNINRDYEIGFTIDNYVIADNENRATLMNTKQEKTGYPGLVFRKNDDTNYFVLQARQTESANQEYVVHSNGVTNVVIYRTDGNIYYSINGGPKTFLTTHEYNPEFNLTTWFGAGPKNALGTETQRHFIGTLSNMYIKLEPEVIVKHTVTFDADGGTASFASKEVNSGGKVGELPTAEKPGYYFAGWYTANGVRVDGTETIHSDTTYYAHWKDIFLVTFETYGGTLSISPNTLEVVDGNTISELPTAEKPGYYFDGWYTEEHGGTKYQGNETITADVTYHARYKEIHTITFETYGGTLSISPNTLDVVDGETISELPTAEKTGMHFDGWYTQETGGTMYQGNEIITSDATYHAHWSENPAELRTVTFKDDNNTTVLGTVQVEDGNSLGLLMINDPTKEDYIFNGWFINGNSMMPFTSETEVSGSDITVVASWKAQIGIASVTTDPSPLIIKLGDTGHISVTGPNGGLVEDYTLLSSNTNILSTLGDAVYGEAIGNVTITVTGNISGQTKVISATVSNTSTITFDPGNGEEPTTIEVANGSTIGNALPEDPTREEYVFDRWYLCDGTTMTTIPINTNKVITQNETYRARWVNSNIVAAIGTSYYSTLSSAINAAPSGSDTEIRIIQDITDIPNRTTVSNSKIITLVGGNHTLSCGASTKNNVLYNQGILKIKSGTFTCARSGMAPLENDSNATMYIENATVSNTNDRGAIYNKGTVNISSGDFSSSAPERPVVQNVIANSVINISGGLIHQTNSGCNRGAIQNYSGGTINITGGTIISDSTNNAAGGIQNVNNGTVVIGTVNHVHDVTSPIIRGMKYGVNSPVAISFYDGLIEGKDGATNSGVTITPENGSTPVNNETEEIDGITYQKLYYVVTQTKYLINFNVNGGEVSTTQAEYELNTPITATDLPTPTKGLYTFDGWYKDENLQTPFTPFTPTEVATVTYYAKWSFHSSYTPVLYTITSDAMTSYFANIGSWIPDTSPDHETFMNNMNSIFTANHCSACNSINSCDGPSLGVFCEQPKDFNTSLNEDLDVYLYNNNQKGSLVTYTTSNGGNIANMIPGTTYYWESKTDSTKYGVITATGERRTIKSTIRNVRDLGGMSVSYTDLNTNQPVTGTINYGRLYRGAQITSGQTGINELTKLGITREIDLRQTGDGNTGQAKLSNYDDDQNPISSKRDIVMTNYLVNPTATPYITTENLAEYRKVKNALRKTMEYVVNGDNIYFHCTIGSDRTGTLAYFLEGLLGVSEEDRLRDYEISYFYGLTSRTRFHDYIATSQINPRFESMYKSYPTNQDIYNYYTYERYEPTGNELDDDQLLTAFRNAMINKNS